MQSSNPVLSRLTPQTTQTAPAGYPGAGYQQEYAHPSVIAPATTDRMTVDDVVVRTVGLLAITGVAGALTWTMLPDSLLGAAWIGGAIIGLILGLIISFKQIANPALIGTYAVVEGVFLGAVSKFYESLYDGIVLQAAVGTFGVFFLMAIIYKARLIRATPKFAKFIISATLGIIAVYVVNIILSLLGITTGFRDGSPLAIGFSLFVIVIASLSFILSFDQIEQGVRAGLPERYSWVAAFGLLVGLIWVYLEILRLLSYLRGED